MCQLVQYFPSLDAQYKHTFIHKYIFLILYKHSVFNDLSIIIVNLLILFLIDYMLFQFSKLLFFEKYLNQLKQ